MKSTIRRRKIRGRRRADVQIDEIGELGDDPQLKEEGYRPSLIFGFGTTETDRSDVEVKIRDYISHIVHKGKVKEVKARKIKIPKTKGLYARLLGMTKANRNGFYINKMKEVPEGWDGADGTARIIGFLVFVIRWYMTHYPDTALNFRIDGHNSYKIRKLVDSNIGALSTELERPIRYEIVDSKKDRAMQANDMVPNSMYEEHERRNSSYADALHLNEYQLDSSDSIRLLITAADLEGESDDDAMIMNKNRRTQWNSAPYRCDHYLIAELIINSFGICANNGLREL